MVELGRGICAATSRHQRRQLSVCTQEVLDAFSALERQCQSLCLTVLQCHKKLDVIEASRPLRDRESRVAQQTADPICALFNSLGPVPSDLAPCKRGANREQRLLEAQICTLYLLRRSSQLTQKKRDCLVALTARMKRLMPLPFLNGRTFSGDVKVLREILQEIEESNKKADLLAREVLTKSAAIALLYLGSEQAGLKRSLKVARGAGGPAR